MECGLGEKPVGPAKLFDLNWFFPSRTRKRYEQLIHAPIMKWKSKFGVFLSDAFRRCVGGLIQKDFVPDISN